MDVFKDIIMFNNEFFQFECRFYGENFDSTLKQYKSKNYEDKEEILN